MKWLTHYPQNSLANVLMQSTNWCSSHQVTAEAMAVTTARNAWPVFKEPWCRLPLLITAPGILTPFETATWTSSSKIYLIFHAKCDNSEYSGITGNMLQTRFYATGQRRHASVARYFRICATGQTRHADFSGQVFYCLCHRSNKTC